MGCGKPVDNFFGLLWKDLWKIRQSLCYQSLRNVALLTACFAYEFWLWKGGEKNIFI